MKIQRLTNTAILPAYQTAGAAAMDLHADLGAALEIAGGARACISSGIAIELPPQSVGLVLPRSGLSMNTGLMVIPGVIDEDYRGGINVMLYNLNSFIVTVYPQDRIAQLLITAAWRLGVTEAASLSPSGRGAAGFGSTGA